MVLITRVRSVSKRFARRQLRRLSHHSWVAARLFYRLHGHSLEGGSDDLVWYFAYGSNLDPCTFIARRGMHPRAARVGCVSGYKLRFNLDGRPLGRAAPANIAPAPGATVWGVAYQITRRELVRLDSTEGVPGGNYRHVGLSCDTQDGEVLPVLTYIAAGNPVDGRPSLRYLTLLRDGARTHGLPDEWIQFLDDVTPAQ